MILDRMITTLKLMNFLLITFSCFLILSPCCRCVRVCVPLFQTLKSIDLRNLAWTFLNRRQTQNHIL
jgi:hypothetical protein